MARRVIGIDPGKSGGIAVMNAEDHSIEAVYKMPQTPVDAVELLSQYSQDSTAYLEQVLTRPGQQGMFEFGRNYGMLETALSALGISHVKVTPQKWEKEFQLHKPKTADHSRAKSEHKRILKAKAQELFPRLKITLATADALLLAEWGYRQERSR